ncbi:MAG: peptidyl-prolyl cis-trans isomerase [Azoarcus sp.]|jgi:peptidyl-prolyl cis-trans isomerase A (cyclophilin A)|nr:peptidyl-prolyl cis-trans isomerase [Azoarcus sp.]
MIRHLIASLTFGLCALAAHAANPQVEIKTNAGDIVLELDAGQAPKSTANFIQYVKDGHYDNTVFHRVIDDFMIQGGGYDKALQQKTTRAPVENEAGNGLKNVRGTVAMARTNAPHSATSQFFINLKDNAFLDFRAPEPQGWGYAVFGKVIKGMDVVDKIAKRRTRPVGPFGDVPIEAVVIESARIIDTAPADAAPAPAAAKTTKAK